MSLITFEEIQGGYEDPIGEAQRTYVEGKIAEAEVVLATKLGDLQTWVDTDNRRKGLETPEQRRTVLLTVVRRIVYRVLRNPKGYTSESEGEYSYGVNARVASGTIWVTDEDWDLLGVGARRRVGSHRLGLPAWSPRNAGLEGPL